MKTFIVYSKEDDYGARRTELVQTTKKNAQAYYDFREVDSEDVEVLSRYMPLVSYAEENERSNDERFYGSD